MANIEAVRAVGESIVQFLETRYPAALRARFGATFQLLSTSQLAQELEIDPAITLLLHRVTISNHLRNARVPAHPERPVPLALDLHYLLTAWGSGSEAEHVMLAWAMYELHRHPVFDSGSLLPAADWSRDEQIHIVPEELSEDAMSRLWETFTPTYRLSTGYIARVVLVQSDEVETTNRRVIDKDLAFGVPERRP